MDPIGYKKSDPKPQVYTKKFVGTSDKIKGDYVYDIFKNGVKVATIDGEGNANAWMNDQMRNVNLQESELRSMLRQIIKEELNLKEIDQIGEEASKEAKIRKINEEISKRKKKLKALETLKELEEDSVNEKKLKELYSEIKKLEAAKNKLEKKGEKKEPIVDEALFDVDPNSNKDKPIAATSPASRIAITKAGGRMIPGTEDAK
jgi:type I site-specific restriction-modification system R (restriction) subunit